MRLELSTFNRATGPANTPSLMAQWRVGAIVEAIAVRDISDGQLWLNIGATKVPARIASGNAAGPNNGERLQLRVLRDHPVLALETISSEDNGGNEAVAVNDALRRFLPRQSSPAPLLANLAWLNNRSGDQQQLPRPVQDALQKLWQALPQMTDLTTPDGLANAVKRSGAFLESTLARHLQPSDAPAARLTAAQDIKALLLNVKNVLMQHGGASQGTGFEPPGPLPTLRGTLMPLPQSTATLAAIDAPARQLNELAAQVDGALARVQTTQAINSEASASAAWLLEVPLQHDHGETIRFRFERHSQAESHEQSWTVEAALDLGGGTALHARVSLYGKRIGVQLRAEPPELVAELTRQAPLLNSMLSAAGLDVDRVVCLHGMPVDERDVRAKQLLDIRV